jgi:hypothetical protein
MSVAVLPDTPVGRMASAIASVLASAEPAETRLLTWSTLARIADVPAGDATLLAAVLYLASDEVAILEARAFLADGDDEHEIEPADLKEAYRTGTLVHPETGENVLVAECTLSTFFVLPEGSTGKERERT